MTRLLRSKIYELNDPYLKKFKFYHLESDISILCLINPRRTHTLQLNGMFYVLKFLNLSSGVKLHGAYWNESSPEEDAHFSSKTRLYAKLAMIIE